jgi:hypothetical protein
MLSIFHGEVFSSIFTFFNLQTGVRQSGVFPCFSLVYLRLIGSVATNVECEECANLHVNYSIPK